METATLWKLFKNLSFEETQVTFSTFPGILGVMCVGFSASWLQAPFYQMLLFLRWYEMLAFI